MHAIEWLWEYLDANSRISIACACSEFYGEVSEMWRDVVIPESITPNDPKLMQILIAAQNIETLTIRFPFDAEEEKPSEAMMRKFVEQFDEMVPEEELTPSPQPVLEDEKANGHSAAQKPAKLRKKRRRRKRGTKFPSDVINPSYLPHLKQLREVDLKSCGSDSFLTFIMPFLLQLPKFIAIRRLCVPQLFTIRHHSLEELDIGHLQVGFDGMNVHLGADLIGVTHLKKQMPRLRRLYCDELYLFVGEDVWIGHEKSGKQYWAVMAKWCRDVQMSVFFRTPIISVMLMPRDGHGVEKVAPEIVVKEWDDIKGWIQDRLQ